VHSRCEISLKYVRLNSAATRSIFRGISTNTRCLTSKLRLYRDSPIAIGFFINFRLPSLLSSDIQGTGSVILGGFMTAARLSAEASGRDLKDHRILFMGAGSAGVGVAKQLLSFFKNLGMSEEEAKERVWLVDTKVSLIIIVVNVNVFTIPNPLFYAGFGGLFVG